MRAELTGCVRGHLDPPAVAQKSYIQKKEALERKGGREPVSSQKCPDTLLLNSFGAKAESLCSTTHQRTKTQTKTRHANSVVPFPDRNLSPHINTSSTQLSSAQPGLGQHQELRVGLWASCLDVLKEESHISKVKMHSSRRREQVPCAGQKRAGRQTQTPREVPTKPPKHSLQAQTRNTGRQKARALVAGVVGGGGWGCRSVLGVWLGRRKVLTNG